ncbi:MAG TPA: FliI/YscN family ATPase [Collimonas sp.]|jgi:type III secretion protein N (ATPase)|nr:FliI/YscN family ATPase [Collimonas sp.]HWW03977.1 FliI/YscN family ATPase [Collimonas sp.]
MLNQEEYFAEVLDTASHRLQPLEIKGRVTQAVGTLIKAAGISARIGDVCQLYNPGSDWQLSAEVVGVTRDGLLLMPYGELTGLSVQTHVQNLGHVPSIRVGPELLGQTLDGFGAPLKKELITTDMVSYPILAAAPSPFERRPVSEVFQTGVRAIDALLTCGRGQRIGIFSPAGSGKSTLLSMIAEGADSDVNVVALVGERGREVSEFIQHFTNTDKIRKTIFVVTTSDRSAAERAKAPCVAMAIAEYFRDQGCAVLLLMDSVTRYARALREIGLAAGEPPTRRGFPPSALTALPKLFERAGQNERGSITSFFTVLLEDDIAGDPIGEEMRATLDGHIILSPLLANANAFPAIDIPLSRSRVMRQVVSDTHYENAGMLRELMRKYESVEMLLQMGEIQQGNDKFADKAIRTHESMRHFLRQKVGEIGEFGDSIEQLSRLVGD